MDKFDNVSGNYAITLTQFTEEIASALKHYFICDTNSSKNFVNVTFPNGQKFIISVAEVIEAN